MASTNAEADLDIFINGFEMVGGELLDITENGLKVTVKFNRYHHNPFTLPEMQDHPILIQNQILRTARGAANTHPQFIFSRVMGTKEPIRSFVISCKNSLMPDYHDFIQKIKFYEKTKSGYIVMELPDYVIVESVVSYIGDRSFAITDCLYNAKSGRMLCGSTFTFGVVDIVKRRSVLLPKEVKQLCMYLKKNEKPRYVDFSTLGDQLAIQNVIPEANLDFEVEKDHLDSNEHLNLSVYFSLTLKSLTIAASRISRVSPKIAASRIKECFLLFKRETVLGDHLAVATWKDDSIDKFVCAVTKGKELTTYSDAAFYESDLRLKNKM